MPQRNGFSSLVPISALNVSGRGMAAVMASVSLIQPQPSKNSMATM